MSPFFHSLSICHLLNLSLPLMSIDLQSKAKVSKMKVAQRATVVKAHAAFSCLIQSHKCTFV